MRLRAIHAGPRAELEGTTFGRGERFVLVNGKVTSTPAGFAQSFAAEDADIPDGVVAILHPI